MQSSIVTNIQQFFKNMLLNTTGSERTLYQYIEDGDIQHALNLMTSNTKDVENALKEYYPQKHNVMNRANKRTVKSVYNSVKIPRARQRYINEIELFFLLANNIRWEKVEGDDEAYKLFTEFLKETRFDTNMRKVKRLAGSETECAKLYRLYKNQNNKPQCDVVILARSLGYELHILKDQYNHLIAAAYGYKLCNAEGKAIQHYDFLTANMTYLCTKNTIGWDVQSHPNPTGKINLIYYQQPKAWDGVEPRLEREEEMDCKIGDTNNYFADPIAVATADVVESMYDPNAPAKLLQLTGQNSRFEYVNPPQASELRRAEKEDLEKSILFDTFTPNFDFEIMRGLVGVSGAAIKNAMALGYIKRANRIEIYGELVDREKKVIIEVLRFLHPEMAVKLAQLQISFEFAEPFDDDARNEWKAISSVYSAGLLSLETAVQKLGIADDAETEINLIRMQQIEQTLAQQEAAAEKQQEQEEQVNTPENNQEN